jgi:hypothetical protein
MDANDRLAIEELFWGYAYGYDTRDWSLYRAIWAPDGELVLADGTTFAGVDAIEAHARGRREGLAAKGIQTRHYQTGSCFEVAGPDDVRVRTMLLVSWQHEGAPAPVLMHTGEYHDVVVRLGEGWRLRRRRLVIDHE